MGRALEERYRGCPSRVPTPGICSPPSHDWLLLRVYALYPHTSGDVLQKNANLLGRNLLQPLDGVGRGGVLVLNPLLVLLPPLLQLSHLRCDVCLVLRLALLALLPFRAEEVGEGGPGVGEHLPRARDQAGVGEVVNHRR